MVKHERVDLGRVVDDVLALCAPLVRAEHVVRQLFNVVPAISQLMAVVSVVLAHCAPLASARSVSKLFVRNAFGLVHMFAPR